MYNIEWDKEENLLLLKNESALAVSEYRPVFSAELKHLGFDRYFSFEESDTAPVLWAIRYTYYYKGEKIAELKEQGCLKKPLIGFFDERMRGAHLPLIDTEKWFEKNRKLLDRLVSDTLLRLYQCFQKYSPKADCTYVAYSAGKDSMVLLDLVKRILPHDRFFVSWIDTGMEVPAALRTAAAEKEQCEREGIAFVTTRSPLDARETWEKIGPPSSENRWCCSVLKAGPNVISLREYIGKKDAVELVYLGNRANESRRRRNREYVSEGGKFQSQIEVNGIINWSSLEVFLYLMDRRISLNEAYIHGNLRVGCLVCPNASTISTAFLYGWNKKEMEPFFDVLRDTYRSEELSGNALEEFINLGKWKSRSDGAGTRYHVPYRKERLSGHDRITIDKPRTDWKEWIKTIGILKAEEKEADAPGETRCLLQRGREEYRFSVTEDGESLTVVSDFHDPEFERIFEGVFQKAAGCLGCLGCVADCPHGKLSFQNQKPLIPEDCLHCAACMHPLHPCRVFDAQKQGMQTGEEGA